MPEQMVYRARDLEVGYGSMPVLARIDLEIRPGESWFLIGPNGTGKTTLLRALLGLLPPRRGTLERHPQLAARERIGFVPQRSEIEPTLPTTVREFAALGFVGSAVGRGERGAALAEALRLTGLHGLERASYWELSGGQRQRALVARALVRRPTLMILDEPTEGLDVRSEVTFVESLAHLNQSQGLTLLFVTHRLALAARHASHAALFAGGTVISGPRADILRSDVVEGAFGVAVDLLPLEALGPRSWRSPTP